MKSTTQVTEITPALLDTLRAAIDTALMSVGEPHGVTLSLRNIRYNEVEATGKLVITATGANLYAVDFTLIAHLYGLVPSDLGKEIPIAGKPYTIYGVKGAGKRPIAVRSAEGVVGMIDERSVYLALGLPWPRPRFMNPAAAAKWRANPTPPMSPPEVLEIMRRRDAAHAAGNTAEHSKACLLLNEVPFEVMVAALDLSRKLEAEVAGK